MANTNRTDGAHVPTVKIKSSIAFPVAISVRFRPGWRALPSRAFNSNAQNRSAASIAQSLRHLSSTRVEYPPCSRSALNYGSGRDAGDRRRDTRAGRFHRWLQNRGRQQGPRDLGCTQRPV